MLASYEPQSIAVFIVVLTNLTYSIMLAGATLFLPISDCMSFKPRAAIVGLVLMLHFERAFKPLNDEKDRFQTIE